MRAGQACTAKQSEEVDTGNKQQQNEEEAGDEEQETGATSQRRNSFCFLLGGGESGSWEAGLEAPWEGGDTEGLLLEEATGEVGRAVSWEDWDRMSSYEFVLEPSFG
eukprot:588516-Hanusia_phi.AAC.1